MLQLHFNNRVALSTCNRRVRDFNTDSNHNYRIDISLDELASIISMLGSEGVDSCPDTIEKEFEEHIKSLNRIVYAASGILTKFNDDVA